MGTTMKNPSHLTRTPDERFDEKVEPEPMSGCHLWTATGVPKGYGMFRVTNPRRHVYAHRYAYERARGPIPDGHHIDHLCNNPRCVNPDHLEAVTAAENNRRCVQRGRGRWRGAATVDSG